MSSERAYDLEQIRADGWFDRVIAGVPALQKLCASIGEPLVALSLAAGFRVMNASVDRGSNEVSQLTWVRENAGTETEQSGTVAAIRAEVMAALLGDSDKVQALDPKPDAAALREFVGQRYLLLAPLFGLTMRQLLVPDAGEARIVVLHDGVEEIVLLRQLRRFLRARVIDTLQGGKNQGVSIDLEQAEVARKAFLAGRYDDVVGRISPWVAPLMVYHRTPEGAALDIPTRAEIAKALGTLGQAYSKLGRADESEETLRLAVQYAHDGPAAGDLYRVLAATMIETGRESEAIGPLRRAVALDPVSGGPMIELARCYLKGGRAVAAYGCIREARDRHVAPDALAAIEAEVRAALGDTVTAFDALVRAADTEPPPPVE